jgi:hypothetical protein
LEITDSAPLPGSSLNWILKSLWKVTTLPSLCWKGKDSTIVTWAMFGTNPYLAKVISMFISMDKMIGKDFEAGLDNLKVVAEK